MEVRMVTCEICGGKVREEDSFINEDSHDILCEECHLGGF